MRVQTYLLEGTGNGRKIVSHIYDCPFMKDGTGFMVTTRFEKQWITRVQLVQFKDGDVSRMSHWHESVRLLPEMRKTNKVLHNCHFNHIRDYFPLDGTDDEKFAFIRTVLEKNPEVGR